MTDILAIPAEFDTILIGRIEPGASQAYVEKRLVPRPPLGPFTHHAVQTFAKTCSDGRIGLNWPDHLVRARETWNGLSPDELSTLHQAAERGKQRYEDYGLAPGPDEALLPKLDEKEQGKDVAPSAFDLFKYAPETRSRLFEAKQDPIGYHEGYHEFSEKAFIWLWGHIDDEEKSSWRQEAKRGLDTTNNARRKKGEEELILDTEPEPAEESPGKRMRLRAKSRQPQVAEGEDDEDCDQDDEDEGLEQKSQNTDAEVHPVDDVLQWAPTEDQNLTTNGKQLLESIPRDLRRWDRNPHKARNAYTLYYAHSLTALGSPLIGEDPHCGTTRAKIHAAWEATDPETRRHFKNLAKIDKEEADRQSKEYNEWNRAWRGVEKLMLLRKVIGRWHPHSSFDEGQNRAPAAIPRQNPTIEQDSCGVPAVEYGLSCLHYPVIRTDYSNGAVYEHLRHILHNSSYYGDPVCVSMTFYDGMDRPSSSVAWWEMLAEDDPRARDYEWCKGNLEGKAVDDLKASLGELAFHRKEHVPTYSFGGHDYAIVIDSQSMKDGTILFLSLNEYDFVDTRPEDDPGLDGAWPQDTEKEWYLAPRLQAADVMIQLANLDLANVDWFDYVERRVDHGLDLFSDPKAQQWRGWQWAIEYIFGDQALANVVGAIETIPAEAFLPDEVGDE